MKHLFSFILLLVSMSGFSQSDQLKNLYNQGFDHVKKGNWDAAADMLVQAQKMAEQENNLLVQCKVQMLLGKIATLTENQASVLVAVERGEKFCRACNDTLDLARVLLQKGIYYIKENRMDTAIQVLRTCADTYMAGRDTMGAANAIAKIGNILEVQGDYQGANRFYLDYYQATSNRKDDFAYVTANIYLTGNYLYLKDASKAKYHNDIVIDLSQKLGLPYEYSNGLKYAAMIQTELGKHKEAYDALWTYMSYYQDSLMTKERLKEVEALEAKYENEKKEAQIAAQSKQLEKDHLIQQFLMGGLVFALLVGGVLFFLVRSLRKRNREKEFLIKEVHHRVKNNLQILSSLLHLQSRQITDDAALDAIREGQNRVDAMGLIHQKLYLGNNVAQVEMKDYLEQFGQTMLDSFGIEDGSIQIVYPVNTLHLDVDTAIPIGLIVNELLANALKYAFPDGRKGQIKIELNKTDQGKLRLRVSDDGVGAANTRSSGTGFGTRLVKMLSGKLKGKVEIITNSSGYATEILFDAAL
jgi:two-component sensor histidine kinase